MAEGKPPSTSDLLFLIPGLQVVKTPNPKANSGEDYYLNELELTEERTLRETHWNDQYLGSLLPSWNKDRFRDWLIATLAQRIGGHKQDFTAISEPLLVSMDLLAKKFTPDMASDAIIQALTSDSGKRRTYFSALSFGVSKQRVGTKEVFLFGAGMRRRVQLWLTGEEALQVDVEFFVPFWILPNSDHGPEVSAASVRSICAGIAVTKSQGNAIGEHEGKGLLAMRFNLRIPFKAEVRTIIKEEGKELQTEFG